jgi:hypothetical protein
MKTVFALNFGKWYNFINERQKGRFQDPLASAAGQYAGGYSDTGGNQCDHRFPGDERTAGMRYSVLLRKERKDWSEEQKNRLPDGIRDCEASHILIEFKYTESVNENALLQALGYDYFYRRTQKLAEHEVGTFLVSSKTPEKETLRIFGYEMSGKPGVYRSENRLLKRISLILLNELSDTPHNAFLKCFASRKSEKASAFDSL